MYCCLEKNPYLCNVKNMGGATLEIVFNNQKSELWEKFRNSN